MWLHVVTRPAGAWWCVDWTVAPSQMVVHWVQLHCFHSPCRHPRLLKMPNPLPDPWWHVSEFPVGCVGSENIFINKYTILSLWTTNTKHLGGQRHFSTWCDILSATTYVVWGGLRLKSVITGAACCSLGRGEGVLPRNSHRLRPRRPAPRRRPPWTLGTMSLVLGSSGTTDTLGGGLYFLAFELRSVLTLGKSEPWNFMELKLICQRAHNCMCVCWLL